MVNKIHAYGVWSGILYIVLFGVGWWPLAGFMPPHPPSTSDAEIARIFQDNTNGIRLGMLLVIIASGFYLPWTVTLSAMTRKMEGEDTFLSKCVLAGGIASSFFAILPALCWEIAAFRPDRSPELTLIFNDAAWLLLMTPVSPFLVQFVPIAIAVLKYKGEERVFPRWLGYATLWANLIYLPGYMAYFFHTGPFAWNGLFVFWVPTVVFFAMVVLILYFQVKSIKHMHD